MSAVPHEVRLAKAMRKYKARFAHDSEGAMIARLVHTCHEHVPNVSWNRVTPYWIVVEYDGEMTGCLQICYSLPVGRLEWMSFEPGLPYKVRALSVKALLTLGESMLKHTGSQVVVGNLGFEQKSFREILQHEGCTRMMAGYTMGRSIA